MAVDITTRTPTHLLQHLCPAISPPLGKQGNQSLGEEEDVDAGEPDETRPDCALVVAVLMTWAMIVGHRLKQTSQYK